MKVEVINTHSAEDSQERINAFLKDNPIKLVSMQTIPYPNHDLYYDGNICNQWIEYITTIIYDN